MTKLIAAIVAGLFSVAVANAYAADDMKKDAKKGDEMKKDDAKKKKDEKKEAAPK
jgi:pentapeptide MXKDX repeat protein